MNDYLRKISWLQHILAWTTLFGLCVSFYSLGNGSFEEKTKDLLVQTIPDLIAALLALIIAYYFILKLGADDKEQLKSAIVEEISVKLMNLESKLSHNSDIINSNEKKLFSLISALSNKVTTVSWSSDTEEHDTNVFNKMSEFLDDSSVTGLDVLSIFHKEGAPKSDGKKAVYQYYDKIESAIRSRKLRYRRVVVVRKPIGSKGVKDDLISTIKNRIEFSNHCKNIQKFNKEYADIKFVHTEGRVIDVAFALFFQGNIQDKNLRTLVMEITVWNTEKSHHVMGLLSIEHPTSDLIKAFCDAFIGVYEGKLDIELHNLENII